MRRRSTVVVALLCAALLPGAVTAAGPSFTPGSPGAGDPYYPLDGNGGYDVKHYDLDLKYTPDTDVLRGVETISARATQNLSSFNLDLVGMNVRSIKVDGRRANWTRDGQELVITPRHGLRKHAKFTVVIKYDGVPEPTLEFGQSGFIATDDGAIIAGEPHGAATWFAANDHPSDKASISYQVTVPKGLQVVANGKLTGRRTHHGWTDLVVGRQGADGDLPRDGEHRRIRHPRLSQAWHQLLGRDRPRPARHRSRLRRPARSSPSQARRTTRTSDSCTRSTSRPAGRRSGSRSLERRKPTGTSPSSRSTRSARMPTGRRSRMRTATRPRTPGSRAHSGAGRGSTRSWRITRRTTATGHVTRPDRPAPGGLRPAVRTDRNHGS